MEWPKTFNELTGIKNPTITQNAIDCVELWPKAAQCKQRNSMLV